VEQITLGTRVGDQPLILAYIGKDCARMDSPCPSQSSLYPPNTTSLLLIWYKSILDVEIQVWRGSVIDPFWHWIFVR